MPAALAIIALILSAVGYWFYCLVNYPVRTIAFTVFCLVVYGVKQQNLAENITAEPMEMSWVTPSGATGYPWKQARFKVTNNSGKFYSHFQLECETPHGSTHITDGSGIMAKTSEYRTYKVEDHVSEMYDCFPKNAHEGKPTGYRSDWSFSTWFDRVPD